MIKVKYQFKEFPNTILFKFFKTEEQVEIFKSQNQHYIFEWFMNIPITEKDYKYIMESVKSNKKLYDKLWTYWFNLKYQKDK
jgi:hypothetical protein